MIKPTFTSQPIEIQEDVHPELTGMPYAVVTYVVEVDGEPSNTDAGIRALMKEKSPNAVLNEKSVVVYHKGTLIRVDYEKWTEDEISYREGYTLHTCDTNGNFYSRYTSIRWIFVWDGEVYRHIFYPHVTISTQTIDDKRKI